MNAEKREPATRGVTTSTHTTLASDATTTTKATLETKANDEVIIGTTPHMEPKQDPWHLEPHSKATRDDETCPVANATTAINSGIWHDNAPNRRNPDDKTKVSNLSD